MNEYQNQQMGLGRTGTAAGVEYDAGLRAYMLKVYNYMAGAVAITGVTAYLIAAMATTNDPSAAAATMSNGTMLTSLGVTLFGSGFRYVVMFAPLAFVMVLSFGINKLSYGAAQMVYWAYSAVMGISLASIFLVFTGQSIAQTFFVTAAAFACLSLYGYTTKRNLSAMGSFLVMGLFGLIIASIVNIFLASSAMQFAISVAGVLIFAGLTAWDTQRIKQMYDYVAGDATAIGKAALMGALNLYLDFINMFMFLLQFLGNRE